MSSDALPLNPSDRELHALVFYGKGAPITDVTPALPASTRLVWETAVEAVFAHLATLSESEMTADIRESYAMSEDGLDFKRVANERREAFDAWLANFTQAPNVENES
jgi:hypothetical protein